MSTHLYLMETKVGTFNCKMIFRHAVSGLNFNFVMIMQGIENLENYFASMCFPCQSEEVLPVFFSPPRDGILKGGEQRTVGRLLVWHWTKGTWTSFNSLLLSCFSSQSFVFMFSCMALWILLSVISQKVGGGAWPLWSIDPVGCVVGSTYHLVDRLELQFCLVWVDTKCWLLMLGCTL